MERKIYESYWEGEAPTNIMIGMRNTKGILEQFDEGITIEGREGDVTAYLSSSPKKYRMLVCCKHSGHFGDGHNPKTNIKIKLRAYSPEGSRELIKRFSDSTKIHVKELWLKEEEINEFWKNFVKDPTGKANNM
jgi:hypothetical protein